jgi:hypothetical protein
MLPPNIGGFSSSLCSRPSPPSFTTWAGAQIHLGSAGIRKNVLLHVSSNKNNFSFPKPQLWASWSRGQVICIRIVQFLKILRWPNSAALHSNQRIFLQLTPIFLSKYLHKYCSKNYRQ